MEAGRIGAIVIGPGAWRLLKRDWRGEGGGERMGTVKIRVH